MLVATAFNRLGSQNPRSRGPCRSHGVGGRAQILPRRQGGGHQTAQLFPKPRPLDPHLDLPDLDLTERISRSPAGVRTQASTGSPRGAEPPLEVDLAPGACLGQACPGSRLWPQLPVASCCCPALLSPLYQPSLVQSSAGCNIPGGDWKVSRVE